MLCEVAVCTMYTHTLEWDSNLKNLHESEEERFSCGALECQRFMEWWLGVMYATLMYGRYGGCSGSNGRKKNTHAHIEYRKKVWKYRSICIRITTEQRQFSLRHSKTSIISFSCRNANFGSNTRCLLQRETQHRTEMWRGEMKKKTQILFIQLRLLNVIRIRAVCNQSF